MNWKGFAFGALGSISGFFLGVGILNFLSSFGLERSCPSEFYGFITSYNCPFWHPHSWSILLPGLGFIFGPVIINGFYKTRFKKNMYNPLKSMFLAFLLLIPIIVYIYWMTLQVSYNI